MRKPLDGQTCFNWDGGFCAFPGNVSSTVQLGDLFSLAKDGSPPHYLLCGDSGIVDDVKVLLQPVDGFGKIDLINTDPPYNANVVSRSQVSLKNNPKSYPSFGLNLQRLPVRETTIKDRLMPVDHLPKEEFIEVARKWFQVMHDVLRPGGVFYVWGGAEEGPVVFGPLIRQVGLHLAQILVWDKLHPVLTRRDYMGNHEDCLYGWRSGAGHKFYGPNNIPDIWSISKIPPQRMVHLTEKPLELATRAIQNSSCKNDKVLDLFAGSGWTLQACHELDRQSFSMEIDPPYCSLILARAKKLGMTISKLDTL